MKEFKGTDLQVLDGFQVPLNLDYRLRTSKSYFIKTLHGYYKRRYMVLSQNELYLYMDAET